MKRLHTDYRKLYRPTIANFKYCTKKAFMLFLEEPLDKFDDDFFDKFEKAKKNYLSSRPNKEFILKFEKAKLQNTIFDKSKYKYLETKLNEIEDDYYLRVFAFIQSCSSKLLKT